MYANADEKKNIKVADYGEKIGKIVAVVKKNVYNMIVDSSKQFTDRLCRETFKSLLYSKIYLNIYK